MHLVTVTKSQRRDVDIWITGAGEKHVTRVASSMIFDSHAATKVSSERNKDYGDDGDDDDDFQSAELCRHPYLSQAYGAYWGSVFAR